MAHAPAELSMDFDPKNAKDLFLAACGLASPAARRTFLEAECDGRPALRQRVEELLAEHDRLHVQHTPAGLDFPATLPTPAPPAAGAPASGRSGHPPADAAQSTVGPYKLLQKLGEGGMGAVWMAEQTVPVHRRVAVKLIKAGMDSERVLARFEAERQALALMDHPNIAKVLDAGASAAGRPYFVMELVKGVPITKFCDQEHLAPEQRLELFIPVCQAVQHAHQKGIIHRDLKPSNILVGLYDGKPIPKVIDFGIAKATGQKLTEKTLFTEVGQIIGTLEYMAPEQAELNNLDIDTRADVYSLGVILYELLTGAPPFSAKQLRGAAFSEMLRLIKEVEPPKPSTRISASEEIAAVAANRQLEPKRLAKLVSGELDWIVMKCLEKERGRRYDTANQLALEIGRYLADEPVQAGPPSTTYRLRKFLHRHRGPVAAAAVVLLALVGGIIGTTVGLVQATQARRAEAEQRAAAERERDAKEQARQDAVEAEAVAKRRLGQIEKSTAVLASVFRDLDPTREDKEGVPLKAQLGRRLEGAANQLDAEAVGDPLAVARLQLLLGKAQAALGFPRAATAPLKKAYDTFRAAAGPDKPETLEALTEFAEASQLAGQTDVALPAFEAALAGFRAARGNDHPDTLNAAGGLAQAYYRAGQTAKALALFEPTRELCQAKLGPDHPLSLTVANNLALVYQSAGRPDSALPLVQFVYEQRQAKLGPGHPNALAALINMGAAHLFAGKPADAVAVLEKAREQCQTNLGPDHPLTLSGQRALADAYRAAGQAAKAVPLLEQTLERQRTLLGPDHADALATMSNLATALLYTGRADAAIPLFAQVYELRQTRLGPDHRDTINARSNLAAAYKEKGQLDKAVPLHEQAVAACRAKLGPDHPDTLAAMYNLGDAYRLANRLGPAREVLGQALTACRAKLGPDHDNTLTCLDKLARVELAERQYEPAIAHLREMAAAERRKYGPDDPRVLSRLQLLAVTCMDAGRADEANTTLLELIDRQRGPGASPALATSLAAYGSNLLKQQKFAEAEAAIRESLAIREKASPDDWTTFNTRSLLGAALAGQQRYADAEPLLVSGYEGMKERAAKIPPAGRVRLAEAQTRLVRLYEAWGKPESAAQWRGAGGP
jgi:serine/threonine protein kinase